MDSALEELNKAIETKIQLLKFTHEQAEKAIEKGNITAMERQRKTLATKVEEVHDIQVKVQERKIEKGDNLEEIQGWNTKIEDSVAAYEKAVADLDKSVKEIRDKEVEAAKWKEERVAVEIREKKNLKRNCDLRKQNSNKDSNMKGKSKRVARVKFKPNCQNLLSRSSRAHIPIGRGFGASSKQKSKRRKSQR